MLSTVEIERQSSQLKVAYPQDCRYFAHLFKNFVGAEVDYNSRMPSGEGWKGRLYFRESPEVNNIGEWHRGKTGVETRVEIVAVKPWAFVSQLGLPLMPDEQAWGELCEMARKIAEKNPNDVRLALLPDDPMPAQPAPVLTAA